MIEKKDLTQMNEYEKVYQDLQMRLLELQTRAGKIKKDIKTPLNRDSEEQAVELENSEVLNGINEEVFKEIIQINKTLDLIEKNRYGKCIECGEQIPVKRLEVIPYTSYCVRCAASK